MPELKALIFDVDGTIADTEETHRLAFNLTFAEYGLEWEWTPRLYEELLRISGGRERMHAYAESLGEAFAWPGNPSDFFREMHRVKTAHYARLLLEGNIGLRPGVRRLLAEARTAGLHLAIATSTRRSNVDTLLDNNFEKGWETWFDGIVTCDEVDAKKPAPDVYRAAVASLGIPARNAIAFEDTRNGNLAALGAGLRTVITTNYFTRNDNFDGASLVLDHLGEPDQPFRPRAGDADEATFVDVPLLRRIAASDTVGKLARNAA